MFSERVGRTTAASDVERCRARPAGVDVRRSPRLTVGRTDDPAERQADAVARDVVLLLRSSSASGEPRLLPEGPAATRIRRSATRPSEGGEVSDDLGAAIRGAQRGGTPLPAGTRGRMESGFGANFGSVRLHTDRRADTLSRALGAEAFTVGSDVFTRSGRLDGSGGDELLAHELTHVVQADTTRIRRKIGFEFEDSAWRVWWKPFVGDIRRVKRHEKVHNGPGYHIEGDDGDPATVANLEVVTRPFDITAPELAALDNAMVDVRAVMGRIGGHAGQNEANGQYVSTNQHQFSKSNVRLSRGNANGAFKMQATMGLALEDIPTLMEYVGHNVPGENLVQANERAEARTVQSGAAGGTGRISTVLGSTPTMARAAVTRLHNAGAGLDGVQRAEFGPPNLTDALVGFLSQVILYAKFLSVFHNDYLKAKIPLMARTNFAALYRLLPFTQRMALGQGNAQALTDAVVTVCNGTQLLPIPTGGFYDSNYAVNVSLVRNLRLKDETVPDPTVPQGAIIGGQLLGNQKYRAFQSLTLGDWLCGITQGVDRLTPATMEAWLKAHEPNLARRDRKRQASNLESFATLGAHTDPADRGGTTDLGVFENRSIAPLANPLTPGGLMDAHQAHTAAHHYLEWLLDLKTNGVPGAFPNAAVP